MSDTALEVARPQIDTPSLRDRFKSILGLADIKPKVDEQQHALNTKPSEHLRYTHRGLEYSSRAEGDTRPMAVYIGRERVQRDIPIADKIAKSKLIAHLLAIGVATGMTLPTLLEMRKGEDVVNPPKVERFVPTFPLPYPLPLAKEVNTNLEPVTLPVPENIRNEITEWRSVAATNPEENLEQKQEVTNLSSIEKALFQGYSPTEVTQLKSEVNKFLSPSANDKERKAFMEDRLAWDTTNFWKLAISNEVKKQYPNLSEAEHEYKTLKLLGIIRNESKGVFFAVSGKSKLDALKSLLVPDVSETKNNLAQGLFQMQPDTAKDIAKALGEKDKNINLKDPATAIKYGVAASKIMGERFPNGLDPLVHYWGEGNVGNLVYKWLKNSAALTPEEMKEMEEDFDHNPEATSKWIKRKEVNFIKLKNSGLVDELAAKSKALEDKDYLLRVLASALNFAGYKQSDDFNAVVEIGSIATQFKS